jgi:hypothetical protein
MSNPEGSGGMEKWIINEIQRVPGLNMSVRALVKPLAGGDFEVYINADMPEGDQRKVLSKAKAKIAAALQSGEAAAAAENNGFFALLFPAYNTFEMGMTE